jgi:ABC-type sugar transport system substrate-binding protein
MDQGYRFRTWHLAALATAALAVVVAAATVQRERLARAQRLGVSVLALSNPDRLMRRLRRAGGL